MDRLTAGAEELGIKISTEQLGQFEIYYRELIDWNKRINLTSITDYEDVQVKHFLDSFTLILALGESLNREVLHIIDVGTGAGIPGLPLKILLPNTRLTLLDATSKKAAFLTHIKDILGLKEVEVLVGRAEEAAHRDEHREKFDVVISRGVAPLVTLVEYALPFCIVGGSFISQKKGELRTEINQAEKVISLLGGRLREVKPVELKGLTDQRKLIVIDKVSSTPDIYPRRSGIPGKRPLL